MGMPRTGTRFGSRDVITVALWLTASAFPISLMIFQPTLMFERGWEQYLGTFLYFVALILLGSNFRGTLREQTSLGRASAWLDRLTERPEEDPASGDARMLPSRLRMLGQATRGTRPDLTGLIELNREASGLDQDRAVSRFTIPRYILYVLPVIGFIGTVEGISKALMNISRVLPMINDLDGFLANLGSVTTSLQIAFDTTLLALFLSASLMLVQTIIFRRTESVLERVDHWVTEVALPRLAHSRDDGELLEAVHKVGRTVEGLADQLRAIAGSGHQFESFNAGVSALVPALTRFRDGADRAAQLGDALGPILGLVEPTRNASSSLKRIEAEMAAGQRTLVSVQSGVERSVDSVNDLATTIADAFERSNRSTQEQLARTLGSLRDAIALLNVSMDQGHVLYRSLVQRLVPQTGSAEPVESTDRSDEPRAA